MRAHILRTILFILVVPAAVRAQGYGDAKTQEAQFRKLITERVDAAFRADTAAYRRAVAPSFVWVGDGVLESADEHMAAIMKEPPNRVKMDITDMQHVSIEGAVATIGYRATVHMMAGAHEFLLRSQILETYVRHDHRWLVLSHAETPQAELAWQKPAALDSVTLQDYVGRYEWWPGVETIVTRKGLQLYNQTTGDSTAAPFNASGADVFYQADDPSLWVFTRDRRGNVTSLVTNQIGGKLSARRLP